MAAEAFEFAFESRGTPLPVTGFVPQEGIILAGETSAWPLGVALQLEPISPGTRIQWENIQRANGWIGARTFGLSMSVRNGRLRFEGLSPGQLPEGKYRAAIMIGGYRFHHRIHEFTIPKDGTAVVISPERAENRRVKLDREITDFDDHTLRIVKASTIDGIGLEHWLRDGQRRDSRKACVLNILAKLRTPVAAKPPLSDGITRLIFADVDRVYAELEPRFSGRFVVPDHGFREDPVIHNTHLRLLKQIPNGNLYDLHSLREHTAKLSLQLTVAVPDEDKTLPEYADVDIDLGNPFTNPLGFIVHVGELIDPGKTDHLSLCEKLSDTACKDFLYYKVE